jgi:hypothetical protein
LTGDVGSESAGLKLFDRMGAPSVSTVEYENITISETLQDRRRTGITVSFSNEQCEQQPIQ